MFSTPYQFDAHAQLSTIALHRREHFLRQRQPQLQVAHLEDDSRTGDRYAVNAAEIEALQAEIEWRETLMGS